jgi:hypothetical protein
LSVIQTVSRATLLLFLFTLLVPASSNAASDVSEASLPPVTDGDDRWGFNAIPAEPAVQRLARDAGARWTRAEFRWDRLETTRGRQSWTEFDHLVDSMNREGIAVQGILIGTPDWAKEPRTRFLPQGINLPYNDPQNMWARYVTDVVTRYKGKVRYWEVWNEPDYPDVFWGATVADYYQMLKVSYQTIKAVDPEAKVLLAGMAFHFNPHFLEELVQLMAADSTAAANNHYFDILAWHTYSTPREILARIADTRRIFGNIMGTRPIWLNETNVPPWDESRVNNSRPFTYSATITEQASYVLQTFAYAVAAGVEKIFVYRFKDEPAEDQAWGMVRENGTLRPAYTAFQVATKYLSHIPNGRVIRRGAVEHVTGRRPGERVSVVWTQAGTPVSAAIGALATSATVIDVTGATRTIQPIVGQYRVDLAAATAKADNTAQDYMIGGAPLVIVESIESALQTAEETNGMIGFSGPWATGGNTSYGYRRTATAGAAASIDFEGTSVTWFTSRGPDRGSARIDVDGVPQGEIDLYSPTVVVEEPLTFGEFWPGSHRLTVTVTGRRIGSASGAFVDVDAFRAATLQAAPPPPEPSRPTVTPPRPLPPGTRPQAAAHSAVQAPAPWTALPVVMRNRTGWTTLISLENTGDEDATGTLRFLNETGAQVASYPFALTTVGSLRLDPRTIPDLPDEYIGSVDVQSTQPIAASVTEIREGADALSYSGASSGSERVYLPLVFKAFNAWDSTLTVQNLDDAPVPVTVTYTRTNTPGGPWTETATVPARAAITLAQAATPGLPPDFVGSAIVTGPAGANLTAVVNAFNSGGSGSSYESVPVGSTQLHAPLLFKDAGGWNTGLQVQNVGSAVTQVTVTYTASNGPGQWREQTLVQPGAAVTFYQPANAQLPAGFVGSAVVTSNGQPLVGIVNEVHADRGIAMAYVTLAGGAPMISAPNLARNNAGWSTGVQVQNLGGNPTTMTFLVQDPDGVLLDTVTEENVPAGASRTFFVPALSNVPEGWRGSGTVVSSNGAPLGGIVNEVRY